MKKKNEAWSAAGYTVTRDKKRGMCTAQLRKQPTDAAADTRGYDAVELRWWKPSCQAGPNESCTACRVMCSVRRGTRDTLCFARVHKLVSASSVGICRFHAKSHRHFYSFIQGSVPEKEAEKRRTNCATLGNGQRAHPSSAPRAESRCRQKSIPTDRTEIAGLGRTAAAATQWRVATKSREESSQR